MLDDEEVTDELRFSTDFGKNWYSLTLCVPLNFISFQIHRQKIDFGVKIRAKLLTTIPDSTSLRFLLLGTISRKNEENDSGSRHIIVYIDFEPLGKRQCVENQDFEKWYARKIGGDPDCLMGHKVDRVFYIICSVLTLRLAMVWSSKTGCRLFHQSQVQRSGR